MKMNEFKDIQETEYRLCDEITHDLNTSINENGIAQLLVSGGRSPIGLFKKLSSAPIDWSKVNIGLVDERWVNADSEHSNERLVRDHLICNNASAANFHPLVYCLSDRDNNLAQSQKKYAEVFSEISVVVLGMGLDGHTASLFPKDESSVLHLAGLNQEILINTISPSEPKLRISCGKRFLSNSKKMYLYISGKEKLSVLNRSKEEVLPIYHFYPHLNVFYSSNEAL